MAERVIVLGLGAMGSAAARSLATRGAEVIGIEQFEPAHDRGSSHGDSRIVRRAYFEHPSYVPLLTRAYQEWARLESESATALFTRTGALMIGAPDSPVVAGTLASVRDWDLPHTYLDAAAMRERFPQFRLDEGEVAVHEQDAGFVRPAQVVTTQLDLARQEGADLRFGTRVEGWDLTADGVEVAAAGETLRADRLVLTAGAWSPALLGGAGLPLRPVRTVMYRFAPVDAAPLQPGRFPVYVWDLADKDAIYGVGDLGAVDAAGTAVSATKVGFHHRLLDTDADSLVREVTDAEVETIAAVLRARLPDAAGDLVEAVVCMYTMTPDEHFVLGHLPGTDDRVSLFAGCSGHGFKFTPLVGTVLADLALDGATPAPIGLFDPTRWSRDAQAVSRP